MPPDRSTASTYRCGARFGLLNATWPLARLDVGTDHITVTMIGFLSYKIPHDQVTRIRFHRSWLSRGIVIESPILSERVIVWIDWHDPAIDVLRAYRYPVDPDPDTRTKQRSAPEFPP